MMEKKILIKSRINPVLLFIFLTISLPVPAQINQERFQGSFYDKKERVYLDFNLHKADIIIPGLEILGKTHGYIHGNVYGIWIITQFNIHKKSAKIRLSNDSGSDAQSFDLTIINDSTIHIKSLGNNNLRKIEKRRLVKTSNAFTLTRQ